MGSAVKVLQASPAIVAGARLCLESCEGHCIVSEEAVACVQPCVTHAYDLPLALCYKFHLDFCMVQKDFWLTLQQSLSREN